MILPFSTKIEGKNTCFPEKILTGLISKNLITQEDIIGGIITQENPLVRVITINAGNNIVNVQCIQKYMFDFTISHRPKLHTLRDDTSDRWKAGVKIDFFINVRQKNMFRFAPVLPVVRTQRVYMSYAYNDIIEISIDGRQLHNKEEIMNFVHNDGFDTWDEFFNYFYPKIKATPDNWYEPKLIHWTDLKY